MAKTKLLIVDDDEDICTQMKWALDSDYELRTAGDRDGALAAFTAHRPLVTLLDLGLPPRPNEPDEGLAVLSAVLALDPLAKVIVISGQGEKQNALRAVGAGAYDFLCKPLDMDELGLVLRRCVYVAELEQEYRALQHSARPEVFEDMLGASPQMQAVFDFIRKVAPTSAPVLILGESGTGKEMVAQALHRLGAQKSGPFVAINCNTIPENLLESELFGHEKGAFTGAHAQRKGHIETAAGGTLFLDEIGELPAPVQVKLLRFLQEKCFQRVGGRQEIPSDARVLAATNRNLEESVAAGKFREDLYFRLAVVVVKVPPLRERGDDIVLVAKAFLHNYGVEHAKPGLDLRARCAARPEPSPLAGQRPRAAEPGAAGGHHGGWQARHRQGPGIDRYPERPAAADAEGGAGKCGTGDGPGRPAASQREDHFRRLGTWHQPADALRADGEAGNRQGIVIDVPMACGTLWSRRISLRQSRDEIATCIPLAPCGLPQDLKWGDEWISRNRLQKVKGWIPRPRIGTGGRQFTWSP